MVHSFTTVVHLEHLNIFNNDIRKQASRINDLFSLETSGENKVIFHANEILSRENEILFHTNKLLSRNNIFFHEMNFPWYQKRINMCVECTAVIFQWTTT